MKYGVRAIAGGGRSSARETIGRVAVEAHTNAPALYLNGACGDVNPLERGGGARAQKALASMDLQRRQQELVNAPEHEVEVAVGVGASSRPMVTMMQRVRDGFDAGLDAVGNVIPDGIPLIGNGSDFTARAQRERDLNARLAEARYYAELEQQKRLKAEQAFKQGHQKWLDAVSYTHLTLPTNREV